MYVTKMPPSPPQSSSYQRPRAGDEIIARNRRRPRRDAQSIEEEKEADRHDRKRTTVDAFGLLFAFVYSILMIVSANFIVGVPIAVILLVLQITLLSPESSKTLDSESYYCRWWFRMVVRVVIFAGMLACCFIPSTASPVTFAFASILMLTVTVSGVMSLSDGKYRKAVVIAAEKANEKEKQSAERYREKMAKSEQEIAASKDKWWDMDTPPPTTVYSQPSDDDDGDDRV